MKFVLKEMYLPCLLCKSLDLSDSKRSRNWAGGLSDVTIKQEVWHIMAPLVPLGQISNHSIIITRSCSSLFLFSLSYIVSAALLAFLAATLKNSSTPKKIYWENHDFSHKNGQSNLGWFLMTPFQQAFDPINIIQFAGVNEEVPKSRRDILTYLPM